jgi:hypothetical protein
MERKPQLPIGRKSVTTDSKSMPSTAHVARVPLSRITTLCHLCSCLVQFKTQPHLGCYLAAARAATSKCSGASRHVQHFASNVENMSKPDMWNRHHYSRCPCPPLANLFPPKNAATTSDKLFETNQVSCWRKTFSRI